MSAGSAGFARLLLWVVPALWSCNYLIARAADGLVPPHLLATGRWLLAALLLLPFTGQGLWARRDALRQEWKHLVVLGALGMWICGAWVYIGGRTTTATNIALIYSMAPVLIFVASALWLKERVTWLQAVGVLLAFAGVLHVVLKGQWMHLADVQFVVGDLWIVGASLAWTAYSLLLKRWQSPLAVSPRLAVIALAGCVVLLPFAALFRDVDRKASAVLQLPGAEGEPQLVLAPNAEQLALAESERQRPDRRPLPDWGDPVRA